MTTFREERTEKVSTLEHLKDLQKASKYPAMNAGAIKRLKWELIGMYKIALNARKPNEPESLPQS